MAWSIPDYSGLKANGPSSNWALGMFELCRAVNEREGGSGLSKTTWYKADGSQASDLTLSDFLGLKTSGVSKVETNLKRIQTAIKGLCGDHPLGTTFVTAFNGDTAMTVSALESLIGSSFLSEPHNSLDSAYWQQLQDALDHLLYFRIGGSFRFGADPGGGDGNEVASWSGWYVIFNGTSPVNTDPEDCWDARFTNSITIPEPPASGSSSALWAGSGLGTHFVNRGCAISGVTGSIGSPFTEGYNAAQHSYTPNMYLDLSPYSGEVGNVFFEWESYSVSSVGEPWSPSFTVNINAEPFSIGESYSTPTYVASSQFTAFEKHAFIVSMGDIDDWPAPTRSQGAGSFSYLVSDFSWCAWVNKYKIYGNLSSVLTDQA